jgi:hypothetical protein
VDVDARLRVILKSHDRIGFGRRGVLDAEQEIRRFAAALSSGDHTRFRQIVLAWVEKREAERMSMPLHYNLPEHVQALALRLCATVPIPESLNALRRLQAGGAFKTDEEQVCREALAQAIAALDDTLSGSGPGTDLDLN